MFMQIAIGAIGIGIVLMVGYIIVAQVRTALPTPQANYANPCYGMSTNNTIATCNVSTVDCGPYIDNTSQYISCDNAAFLSGTSSVEVTIFAGFGLVAVGIIVLAAFGLINVFQ